MNQITDLTSLPSDRVYDITRSRLCRCGVIRTHCFSF